MTVHSNHFSIRCLFVLWFREARPRPQAIRNPSFDGDVHVAAPFIQHGKVPPCFLAQIDSSPPCSLNDRFKILLSYPPRAGVISKIRAMACKPVNIAPEIETHGLGSN